MIQSSLFLQSACFVFQLGHASSILFLPTVFFVFFWFFFFFGLQFKGCFVFVVVFLVEFQAERVFWVLQSCVHNKVLYN